MLRERERDVSASTPSSDWWWRWRRNVSFSLSASLSLFSALTLSSHAHLWSLKLSFVFCLGLRITSLEFQLQHQPISMETQPIQIVCRSLVFILLAWILFIACFYFTWIKHDTCKSVLKEVQQSYEFLVCLLFMHVPVSSLFIEDRCSVPPGIQCSIAPCTACTGKSISKATHSYCTPLLYFVFISFAVTWSSDEIRNRLMIGSLWN